MALRVIAGEFGGRVINSVRGRGTRPLRGQVREALFSILDDVVEDAVVWDLFAGTGCTGIEALSRGARAVLFVEKSNQALSVLRSNVELLGEAGEECVVLRADAWLPELDEEDEEFAKPDLIFLDPPYQAVAEDPVRCAVRAASLIDHLAPGGVLCFHFEDGVLDEDDFDAHLDVDLRTWGRSAVAIIRVADSEADERDEHDEDDEEPAASLGSDADLHG